MPHQEGVRKVSRSEAPGEYGALLAAAAGEDCQLTILFTAPTLNRQALSEALRMQVSGPVLACTTAGELGPIGVQADSAVGVSLHGDLRVEMIALPGVSRLSGEEIQARTAGLRDYLEAQPEGWSSFGLVLVDGLSFAEERLMAALHAALPALQVVGGSAGDGLEFKETAVWWDGEFHTNLAVVCVVSTPQPWRILKTQHIQPTETVLVITEADPRRRMVLEIDGEPAADAYARAVGVERSALGPEVFSRYPLVLHIGGDTYVRAIQRVEPDGSLVFFCAIEEGLVLSLGKGTEILPDLARCLDSARAEVGEASLMLGFDCILRRLELIEEGALSQINAVLTRNNLIGFHTYGEQCNGLHVSQSFTGVALGTQ